METNKKKWIALGIIVVLLIVLLAGWHRRMRGATLAKDGYQAVFLTNGQVYFGKLSYQGRWLKLTDIYYLQVTQPLQPQGTDQPQANPNNQIQLVKLGSELHGPEDEMFIENDKLLFWENLKDDSKVVQKIKEAK